jgi:dTDP-4-amino-4,6-dideoxygalactose transaminase
MEPIRFQRPELPADNEVEGYFAASREARWFSNHGPCHRLLADRLGAFLGREISVVPVASGTLGLMLALRTLVGDTRGGALVVAPSFTFPATAQAIVWNGLRPLWVDVDSDGWHLDPEDLREILAAHREDVAAVVACSTFGSAPSAGQSAAWEAACSDAAVPLVVDSAAGFGSSDEDGRLLGAQGDAEVFSFHATKPFAIGEGGAVTTTDRDFADRLSAMTNFAFGENHQIQTSFGLNAKLSEVHAAIGLAVLDGFDRVLEALRTRAERLRSELQPVGYRFQAGARQSAWQFVPVLAPNSAVRDAVLTEARERNVEIRAYHTPLHRLPAFGEHSAKRPLPVTEDLGRRSLSLPLANDLSDNEIQRIVTLLQRCAESAPGAERVSA